jgi:DNA-binding winged helix-turn-helix (wHTH) protein/TolB-like protein
MVARIHKPMLYRFGAFEFDMHRLVLRKDGRAVALEPQPAKALARLLACPGEVVSRAELRDALWDAGTHVDFDRGLAYCVSQVRAALGDRGESPVFVQTLPRRGFKFVAPVSPVPEAHDRPATRFNRWLTTPLVLTLLAGVVSVAVVTVASLTGERVVIAVSVFDNETGQPEHTRAVAGLSDLVVESLVNLAPDRIAVVGNAAVLRRPRNIRDLKAVAEGVDADYVLLGQLQRGESGLRFITHFIRLRDEAHLKANRLPVSDESLLGLEAAVTGEFERAVREHILTRAAN